MIDSEKRASGANSGEDPKRPGASWANWSVVTSETGRRALGAIAEVAGFEHKWSGLTDPEDRVRRAILDLYVRSGHAPDVAQVAGLTGMAPDEARAQMDRLWKRDLIVLDEADGTIMGAYPFTERAAGHRVRLGGRELNAMCAIDALGAGAMCRTDSEIESSCLFCGAGIRVATQKKGAVLESYSPSGAIVWSGIEYADRCSATSLCSVLSFFCSDEHLLSWREANPDAEGFKLSLEEALEVGRAIFMNHLFAAGEDIDNPL